VGVNHGIDKLPLYDYIPPRFANGQGRRATNGRMNDSRADASRRNDPVLEGPWFVRLFIAGYTPASMAAIRNLKVLEAEYFPPGSKVEIIDLLEQPEAGRRDHVMAIPTLIRIKPEPLRRIIGSLSDFPRTLKILGFKETS
jgi:circadian clock protein KaiB